MLEQNRDKLRQMYHDVWQKMQTSQSLSGLENMIATVINEHPEYHPLLDQPANVEQEYFVENGQSNPYLHMGLHLSLHEQISTDRPEGIRSLYQQLLIRYGSTHETEHQMVECLAASLWQAQSEQRAPSEQDYLRALKKLI